jgi:hypothetical protein
VTGLSLSPLDPADGTLGRPSASEAIRAEFAELARQSGRLLNERSHSQIIGAENLLTKAVRALDSGDAERAVRLIQRAAQIPYDPREEGSPGVRGASMLVYTLITDRFEASADDDMTWLDVVLNVHSGLNPVGQAEVASVVHGFVLQERLFSVSPAEKRRIQHAFGGAPLEADLGDGPDTTPEQREAIIRSLVMATLALGAAYGEATATR